jgi:glycosyltransferase involved in cell wall biosynthesis
LPTADHDIEVSFVVPCYNYGRFLPDCLGSIFRQAGSYSFEIIAVDDASSDDTPAVLERFADSRLRVIRHTSNQGHVKTITRGLREARGRLVARIDPDDRYRPCFLRETMPRFAAHPEVALVYGDAALIDAEGRVMVPESDRVHAGRDFRGNEFIPLLSENFVCAPTVIARREAWIGTLPVPARLAFNDWYFNLMIARRHDFYFVSKVLADYRVHTANHHAAIVRDRSEEPSILLLLDTIFRQAELNPAREREKQIVRNRVYANQYLALANKYFGFGMNQDARRCYLHAVRHAPKYLLNLTVMRRLAATGMQRRSYDRLKQALGYSRT